MLSAALEYRDRGISVIPLSPNSKIPQKGFDVVRWRSEIASEDQIKEWWSETPNSNIGIITGKLSNLFVLDIDTDEGRERAQEYLPDMFEAPRVETPSGGQHIYMRYRDGITIKSRILDGVDYRCEGGYVVAPPSINGNGKPYSWVPFCDLDSIDMPDIPDPLYNILINKYNKHYIYKGDVALLDDDRNKTQQTQQNATISFAKGSRDETMFHVAYSLLKGGMDIENARLCLHLLAEQCSPPFPVKDLEAKLQSAKKRVLTKERNLTADIREWVSATFGIFSATMCYKEQQIATSEDKHKVRTILGRLVDEGIIERYGNKNGQFRRIETETDEIDWRNADTNEYDMQFPLGIERLVKVYPGNIIVLAGASNSGKTAYLLDLIRLNQNKKKVTYFSSEMGAQELKLRLKMFEDDCPMSDWNFKAVERSSDFADVIDPGNLNIIDFMEVYEDFWKIGGWIRDVHKKLDGGVAVIAIQKKSNTKDSEQRFGRGGELTIEKPRLYLAMDRGRIEIIKAKIWRSDKYNPNGLVKDFKLIGGHRIMSTTDWHRKEDDKYADFK
jgi:hypothetical protein